jgi:hypothetical protein
MVAEFGGYERSQNILNPTDFCQASQHHFQPLPAVADLGKPRSAGPSIPQGEFPQLWVSAKYHLGQ